MRYVLLAMCTVMMMGLAVGCGQPPSFLQCQDIVDCQGDTACVDGQCKGVYGREYKLTVQNAKIPEKNLEGQPWDIIGGLPDTYCEFDTKDGKANTSVQEDTLSPSWSTTRNVILIKDDPIQFRCFDSDPDGDDVMFSKQYTVSPQDIRNGTVTIRNDQGFTLNIKFQLNDAK